MSLEQNWKEEAAEPQTAVTKQREFLVLWGGPVPPWPEAGLCSPPPSFARAPRNGALGRGVLCHTGGSRGVSAGRTSPRGTTCRLWPGRQVAALTWKVRRASLELVHAPSALVSYSSSLLSLLAESCSRTQVIWVNMWPGQG